MGWFSGREMTDERSDEEILKWSTNDRQVADAQDRMIRAAELEAKRRKLQAEVDAENERLRNLGLIE
jgi:hypothetical protein